MSTIDYLQSIISLKQKRNWKKFYATKSLTIVAGLQLLGTTCSFEFKEKCLFSNESNGIGFRFW